MYKQVVVTVLVLVLIVQQAVCDTGVPCVRKYFDADSNVCVCNSTYCDSISAVTELEDNEYVIYSSNIEGLRFYLSNGTFLETNKKNQIGYDIRITRDYKTNQEFLGFGGAFTDAAGINIKSLSNATQEHLMKSYFSKEGISYNFGRVPIGGCDFSTHGYTSDDIPDDTKLRYFNLTMEDYEYKIPLIQQANAIKEEPLNLIATAWSAPAWMKTNNALTGRGELKEKYYQLWAQYLILFLDFYKKSNIDFWGITTGNEPINGDLPSFLPFVPKFNSMGWHPETVTKWIVNNMGPTLRSSQHNTTKLIAIDDQRFVLPWWIDMMVKANKSVEDYIDGVGVHWYWDQFINVGVVDQVRKKYPKLFVLNTEASIGDKPWDFSKVKLGSWSRAEMYLQDISENLNHGSIAWLEWNLALNEKGGPNWKDNFVDAPIIVNSKKDEFYKQPMFYAIGHFSKFIKKGSRVLKVTSENSRLHVVATLDKEENNVVVVLSNPTFRSIDVTIKDVKKGSIPLTLLHRSVITILYRA